MWPNMWIFFYLFRSSFEIFLIEKVSKLTRLSKQISAPGITLLNNLMNYVGRICQNDTNSRKGLMLISMPTVLGDNNEDALWQNFTFRGHVFLNWKNQLKTTKPFVILIPLNFLCSQQTYYKNGKKFITNQIFYNVENFSLPTRNGFHN